MNEHFMKLAKDSGLYHELPNGDLYPMAMSAEECDDTYNKFAELIYKDIITVVAAQALSNHSALDVFKNLRRIYEGIEE